MKGNSCLITGIASIAALWIFSTAGAAAIPEHCTDWQDNDGINSRLTLTHIEVRIERKGGAPQCETLSRTTEYPHYRPPQASSYPSAKAPSSEKKPDEERDKD